ncbi:DUF6273 domain-containing protein [Bianquea renquensis]|uniref:DUF6273 domain-containing protein n=1 Tax=Bianquea renquensis TaxID=2763661 RepID=A0A926DWP0_9FIRM|nr:DUF6273 domain-containing protein [Bianquea renquensis]MBC8545263.1 hypothetical protein [Bianquea renquensis]
MKAKHKKQVSAVVAAVLVVAIALTGTFAWQSISQTALNEVEIGSNPGGRLHDDFNGKNKDVYVENFSDSDFIFARIQLREYMETGKDAGTNRDSLDREASPVVAETDINDTSTWTVHTPGGAHSSFHNEYWKWTMGGETVFMPTFDKNKDSLAADINGTFAGPDGDPDTDNDRYDDYVEYALDDQKTADAVYDADDDEDDEGDAAVEGVDVTTAEETHTAKATQEATVLTMEEWKAQGSPTGKYWVYDSDGWAYWAEPLAPGEATGLLLDGIERQTMMTELYYAIHVTAQFSTVDSIGSKTDGSGFFRDGVTDDAFLLLSKISGNSIVSVTADNGTDSIYQTGTLQFYATVGAFGETAVDQSVTWTVSGQTSADTAIDAETGLLTVGADEPIDGVLTITATATGEAPYTGQRGTIQVKVRQATLYEITPGTTATVSIDGIEWYCLVKDEEENKALIWANSTENPGTSMPFGSSNVWRDSAVRTYLNETWLEGTTVLKEKAVETDITTRSAYNASTWITTTDKVFLLSEADLFGTFNGTTTTNPQDYTYGNSVLVPNVNMRKTNLSGSWLRSPRNSTRQLAYVITAGTVYNTLYTDSCRVRPALWVDLS